MNPNMGAIYWQSLICIASNSRRNPTRSKSLREQLAWDLTFLPRKERSAQIFLSYCKMQLDIWSMHQLLEIVFFFPMRKFFALFLHYSCFLSNNDETLVFQQNIMFRRLWIQMPWRRKIHEENKRNKKAHKPFFT